MRTLGHARRAAFVGLISFAMVATAGLAAAQEDETTAPTVTSVASPAPEVPIEQAPVPAELPEPVQEEAAEQVSETATPSDEEPAAPERPLVSVLADCYNGSKSLGVWIYGADGVTYQVTLAPAGGGASLTETSHEHDDGNQVAFFVGPLPGSYVVTVVGSDGSEGGSEVTVEACSTLEPGAPLLTVDVKCVNDYGTVFIRVANPGTGDVRTFAVEVEGLELWDGLRLSGGYFVDIVEQDYEDGTYTVALLDQDKPEGKQQVASAEFTVACAPVPPSTVEPTPTTAPSTTVPAPQGGTVPAGGLASTGAAVGGLAVLGVVALALGAALVLVGRRRRGTNTE